MRTIPVMCLIAGMCVGLLMMVNCSDESRYEGTNMNRKLTRRRSFIQQSALLGAGVWAGTAAKSRAQSPNERLNVAVIGCGGRGAANLSGLSSQNIVALCDVDHDRAKNAFKQHPKAKAFYDYRRMFDAMSNQIDAVAVSTPDHTHFHPSMIAMDLGKHLYCEKPMAHSVDQARRMTKKATETGVATQLGVQRHTIDNVHRVVELIKSHAIGRVLEVHSWVSGDRGMPEIPQDKPAIPSTLKWDLWLGQGRERTYHPTICPYGWRFWWDYGTGETGNWGCHILDIPFWALDLKYPTRVDAVGPEPHELTTPNQMAMKFEFAADRQTDRPSLDLYWHHSKPGPDVLKVHGLDHWGNTVFIGTEGILHCDFGRYKLYPEEKFASYTPPPKSIPDSPGFHQEFIDACKGGEKATCNFDYSGPLAETVLLGNAAFRAGGGFDWNGETATASGNPNAERYLQTYVRKGWEI